LPCSSASPSLYTIRPGALSPTLIPYTTLLRSKYISQWQNKSSTKQKNKVFRSVSRKLKFSTHFYLLQFFSNGVKIISCDKQMCCCIVVKVCYINLYKQLTFYSQIVNILKS